MTKNEGKCFKWFIICYSISLNGSLNFVSLYVFFDLCQVDTQISEKYSKHTIIVSKMSIRVSIMSLIVSIMSLIVSIMSLIVSIMSLIVSIMSLIVSIMSLIDIKDCFQ